MRPIFTAELVNRPFGDPGLYLDLKFARRALLFDIGDISVLSTRKLLRISDVFVSHTHMDHFSGFDHLLRVCLGRDTGVNLYGPPNFIEQVEHKLHAYTWNLVENYSSEFVVVAHELDESGCLRRARFSSMRRFRRESLKPVQVRSGVLLDDSQFAVRAGMFDHHGLPTLAFLFEEGVHINVWKNRLEEFGLPTGHWLTELKRLVAAGAPDATPIRIQWRRRGGVHEETFELGVLRDRVLQFVPGQRLAYVTDVAGHAGNTERLTAFLKGVDLLFVEAVFLHSDFDHATKKAHLTAHQAGSIARAAGARSAIPFHFSSRYIGREQDLHNEFGLGLRGAPAVGVERRSHETLHDDRG